MSFRPEIEREAELLEASSRFLEGRKFVAGRNLGRLHVPILERYLWRPYSDTKPPELELSGQYTARMEFLMEEGAFRHNRGLAKSIDSLSFVQLTELSTAQLRRGRLVVREEDESLYDLSVRTIDTLSPEVHETDEQFTISSIFGIVGYVRVEHEEGSVVTGRLRYDDSILPEEDFSLAEAYDRACDHLYSATV